MRMIFGVLSLLLVLAIVGVVGKKQLQALGLTRAAAALPTTAQSASPAAVETTVPAQAQGIQNNVRDAANAALQKGAERNDASQP